MFYFVSNRVVGSFRAEKLPTFANFRCRPLQLTHADMGVLEGCVNASEWLLGGGLKASRRTCVDAGSYGEDLRPPEEALGADLGCVGVWDLSGALRRRVLREGSEG